MRFGWLWLLLVGCGWVALLATLFGASCAHAQEVWQEDQGRTRFELSAGGSLLLLGETHDTSGGGGGIGGVVTLGFRREVRSDRESGRQHEKIDPLISAETIRIFTGNQCGMDLRLHAYYTSTSAPYVLSAGIAPVLRFHKNGSRWRFPSLFGAILPEVGATALAGRPALHVAFDPIPIAVATGKRTAVEMHPVESLFIVPFDGTFWMASSTRVSVVFR